MINNPQIKVPPAQLWKKKYPSILSGILSSIQLLITIVIIGCEVGSMLIDIVTGTIYVGLWASLFFIVAWISQLAAACCCCTRGCATYTLIIQIISMVFAMCVIGFDVYYIIHPTTCFFSATICASKGYSRGIFYSDANFDSIKIPLIKAQLAAGAVMVVLCIIYVIIYIITAVRVQKGKQSPIIYPQVPNPYPHQYPYPVLPTVSNNVITPSQPPPVTHYYPTNTVPNSDIRTAVLVCPTCNTVMDMTASRRPPM